MLSRLVSTESTSARPAETGLYYALQTLKQLLPPPAPTAANSSNHEATPRGALPLVEIHDKPRFAYRGLHLDVCRHFFPVAFIKRYLDLMAQYKLNRFHWHLTDDQGWRLEIKKYPRLTAIGAYRRETLLGHSRRPPFRYDGIPHGGYYTQEEARDIVRYAQERCITVIPEIEMPGHSAAALTAYPEFASSNADTTVGTMWGPFPDIYAPTEPTFRFLEDVLSEVLDIFPSQYIHIGGDEAHKTQWEDNSQAQALISKQSLKDEKGLQSYFIRRIERYLLSRGRRLIGWDEILEGGLAPEATVMSWRGTEGGIQAARQGHAVIMSPEPDTYFDFYQSLDESEPLAIGGHTPVSKVYAYEPIPSELTEAEACYVLGPQANVWSEYLKTPKDVEYMVFPRALAFAEVAWSAKKHRDWRGFAPRLATHTRALKTSGVHVAEHLFDVEQASHFNPEGALEVTLFTHTPGEIHFTLDGSPATLASPVYTRPLVLKQATTVSALATYVEDSPRPSTAQRYEVNHASGCEVTYLTPIDTRYSGSGPTTLTSARRGTRIFNDGRWQGFEDTDVDLIVDLGSAQTVQRVTIGALQDMGYKFLLPAEVSIWCSKDIGDTAPVATVLHAVDPLHADVVRHDFTTSLPETSTRYIRIQIKNPGPLPGAHYRFPGEPSWVFIDQILIH